jgi:myo-inositol 2-dehydrogenase / D-chiro-inositol 1-dehydrogenase
MLRIGIVGAGAIAETHAGNLARIEGVRIAGVLDAVPERAAAMAGRCGATAYRSLGELLAAVDAIYLCTPPRFHREAAVPAARAGVNVFCEKPLAASVEDAEAIAAAVESAGIMFAVGFNFRTSPPFMRFKELVDLGQLGDVHSFWGVRVVWLPHLAPNWRTDPRFLCGMTIESMSHDFDFMRWLVGDVTSVMGKVATSRPDLNGYDNIMSAVMTLKSGGMASFHSSWASHLSITQYGLIGTQGTAVSERGVVRWKREDHPSETIIECNRPEDQIPSHQRETELFIECLRTGQKPVAGVRDGLATVRISHAVLESARQNRAIGLD